MTNYNDFINLCIRERSHYYSIPLCDLLEKPKNLIYQGAHFNSDLLSIISSIGLAILLAVPAVVGYQLSQTIYLLSGEKIKENDYKAQLNEWKVKLHDPRLSHHALRAVLDGFIRQRIKATDCPFDTIVEHNIHAQRCIELWGYDGAITKYAGDWKTPMKKVLFLTTPCDRSADKFMIHQIGSTINHETMEQYWKRNIVDSVAKPEKVSFAWIPISIFTNQCMVDLSTLESIKAVF